MKKGRVVSFFDSFGLFFDKDKRDIKEWKSELNITIKIENFKFVPSLSFIYEWPDGDAALKYIEERKRLINNG